MPNKKMKKLAKALDKAYHEFMLDLGQQTLDQAKGMAPEHSGALRESARLIKNPRKGWTVVFEAPYSSTVHDGSQSSSAQRNFQMNVKSHIRRHASGKVSKVRSHKKQYKNYQGPHQVGPEQWRITNARSSQEGIPFLTKAWEQVRAGVKDKTLKNALPQTLSSEIISRR